MAKEASPSEGARGTDRRKNTNKGQRRGGGQATGGEVAAKESGKGEEKEARNLKRKKERDEEERQQQNQQRTKKNQESDLGRNLLAGDPKKNRIDVRLCKERQSSFYPCTDESSHGTEMDVLTLRGMPAIPEARCLIKSPRTMLKVTQDLGGEIHRARRNPTLMNLDAFFLEYIIGMCTKEEERKREFLKTQRVLIIIRMIS